MEILENVLSIDKIKHLQELGVNTGNASMTWMLYPYEEGKQPQLSLREWGTNTLTVQRKEYVMRIVNT